MKKGREMKNLPVLDVSSGEQMGCLDSFIIDKNYQLSGIRISSSQQEQYCIPAERIYKLGKDAILVDCLGDWKYRKKEKEEDFSRVIGTLVLDKQGTIVGTVEDLIIEEKEKKIIGYEISDGHLKDVFWGRKMIPVAQVLSANERAVTVMDDPE